MLLDTPSIRYFLSFLGATPSFSAGKDTLDLFLPELTRLNFLLLALDWLIYLSAMPLSVACLTTAFR